MSYQEQELPQKTHEGRCEETTEGNKDNDNPNASPPPYSECSSQGRKQDTSPGRTTLYPLLTKLATESALRRYTYLVWSLVEVIAVTFSTDVRNLRRTINRYPNLVQPFEVDLPFTIMNIPQRALLAEMCALVQMFEREMADDRWLLVHPMDKQIAVKTVLEPIQALSVDLEFALQLLGRFSRSQNCRRPDSTLLDHWMKSPKPTHRGDIMASHALFAGKLPLQEEVRMVLMDYIAVFQEKEELQNLRTSKYLQELSSKPGLKYCWPITHEYANLAKELRRLQPNGPVTDLHEWAQTRLKDKISLRRMKEAVLKTQKRIKGMLQTGMCTLGKVASKKCL